MSTPYAAPARASSEDEWDESEWEDATSTPATGGPTSSMGPPTKSTESGKRKRSDSDDDVASDDDEDLIDALAQELSLIHI